MQSEAEMESVAGASSSISEAVYGKVANILAYYSGVLGAVRNIKFLRLCRQNHSESTDSELGSEASRLQPNTPLGVLRAHAGGEAELVQAVYFSTLDYHRYLTYMRDLKPT
jgi:hypothetical protein